MIIQNDKEAFESQLPPTTKDFGLKSSPIAFKILSDGLYKNKILAVIRELCCNAYDAHVAAGKEKEPFNLHLPTDLDPVFRVEDFGVGLPPTGEGSVEELYTTYFESTKRDSNKFIGALGLGSKSPFAYTNNFTVKTRWNGVEYTFICCVDETYRPNITQVGSVETDQPNGLTVEFAVKPSDFDSFYHNTTRVFKYWLKTRRPNVRGYKIRFEEPAIGTYQGTKWFIEIGLKHPVAVMGNVAYPVSIKEANLTLSPIAQFLLETGLVYRFKLGELNFAPSREDLSYDGVTSAALVKAAEHAAGELLDKLNLQLKDVTSLSKFVERVSDIVRQLSASLGRSRDEVVKFIIDARASDKLKYQDAELSLHELLSDRWFILEDQGHSHRGLYRYWDSYGDRDVMTFLAPTDDPAKASGMNHAKWMKPKLLNMERKGPATRALLCMIEDWTDAKRKFYTYHSFSIRNNPIFVVDDLKTGGPQKAASFKRHEHRPVYLLTTNVESDNHDKLVARLKAQLTQKFGSVAPEVVKSSQLSDFRPPADRVKKPKANTTRVTLVQEKNYDSDHVMRSLFGASVKLEAMTIRCHTKSDLVKWAEVTGYYVVRNNGSLYWDLNHSRVISHKTLSFLVNMQRLKVSDTIFALTPKEVEKYVTSKKSKLKPLEDVYVETMASIKTDDVKHFYTLERLSRVSLFNKIQRMRNNYGGLRSNGSNRGLSSMSVMNKQVYRTALKAIATYKRLAPKSAPLNAMLSEAIKAQRELKRSSTEAIWKFMLLQESTEHYVTKASVKRSVMKDDDLDMQLVKHYPLIAAADVHEVDLTHVLDYVCMMDERRVVK